MAVEGKIGELNPPWRRSRLDHGVPSSDDRGRTGGRCHPAVFVGEGAANARSWWPNDSFRDCSHADSELAARLNEVNLGPTSPRQAPGGASSFAARRASTSTSTQFYSSASGVGSHLTSLGLQGPGRAAPAASCAAGNSSAADAVSMREHSIPHQPSKLPVIPHEAQRCGGALSPPARPCRRQPESDGDVCGTPPAGEACLQARHAPKPTATQPGSVAAGATPTSLGVLSVASPGLTCQPPTPGRLALLARHGDGSGPLPHTLGEVHSRCEHTQQHQHQHRRQSNAASRGPQHEPLLLSLQGPQRAGSQQPPHRRSLDDCQRPREHPPQHKHAEPPAAAAAPLTAEALGPMWVVPPPPTAAPAVKCWQKLPMDAMVAFLPVPAAALAVILAVAALGVGGRGGGGGDGWEWAQVLPGVQAVCVMSWLQCCWTVLPRGQGGGRRTAVRLTQLAACLLGVVMLLPWGGRYGGGLVAAALDEDGTLDLAELATLLGRLLMPGLGPAAWPGDGGSGAGQGAGQGRGRGSAGRRFQSLEEAEMQSAAARLQVCLAAVLAVWALQVVAACVTLPPAGAPSNTGPYAAAGGGAHLAASLAAQKSHLDLPSLSATGPLSQPNDLPSPRADGLDWHVGRYCGSRAGGCGARGGGGGLAGPTSPSRAAAALLPGTLSLKSSCNSTITTTTAVPAIDHGGTRGQGKEQRDEEAVGGDGQQPQAAPPPQQQQARALSVLALLAQRLLVVAAYVAQFAVAAALMGVWRPPAAAWEVPEMLAGGRPPRSTAAVAEPSSSSAATSPHHPYATPVPWPTVALLLAAMAAPLPLPHMLLSRRCMPFVQHTALLLRPAAGPSRMLGLLLLDVNAAKLLAAVAVGLLLGSWPAGAFTWQLLQVLTLVYGMTKLYLDSVRHQLSSGTVAAGAASKGEGVGGVFGTAGLGCGGGSHQGSAVATPVAGGCTAAGWVAGGERERREWSLAPDAVADPRVGGADGGEALGALGLPTTRSVFCGGAGAGLTSSSASSHPSLSPCSSDHSLCGSGGGATVCGAGPGGGSDPHHIAARRPLLAAGPQIQHHQQHSNHPHPYQQALQLQRLQVPSSSSCCAAAAAAPALGRNLSLGRSGPHGAFLCLKPDGGGCAGRSWGCSLAAAARCARAYVRTATRPWSLMLGSLCLLASLLWVALIAPPLAVLGDGPSDLFEGLLQTGPGAVTVLVLVAGTAALLLAAAACLAWCGMRGELRRRYRLEHVERRRLQCLAWSCGPPLAVAAASGLSWALGEERNAGAFVAAEALRAAALWPLVWLQEPWLLGGVERVGGCVQHGGCGVTCCILRWCRLRPSGAAGPGGRCDVQEGGGGGGSGLEGRERERSGAQLTRGSSGRRGLHAGGELHIEVN